MYIKSKLLPGMAIALAAMSLTANAQNGGRKLLDPANIDASVRPGDNFFMYANGAWLKNNPIPKSETRWGSFNELQENNYKALLFLLDSAASVKNAPKGSIV